MDVKVSSMDGSKNRNINHPSLLTTFWSFLSSGVDKRQVVESKNGRF